jgi:uncharacterized protein (TIGR04255 family)
MNRTLPPLKLSKSPLVLVLCQVRFAPIMAMSDYFPRIQDKLRLNGYPLAKNAIIQEAVFTPAGATSVKRERWQVQDKAASRSVVVTENFIVFQTTAYSVFEDFVRELNLAVDTLAGEVKQLLIQRVGLRYVDLVRSGPGGNWTDFVQPGLQGLKSETFLEDTQSQLYQSVANTSAGTMIVRLFQNREGQVLPPDLGEADDLKPRLEPAIAPKELLTILDLDHFSTHQVEYEKGWVEQQAWQLHDGLDRVFRKSLVTPKALEVWT